MSFSLERWAHSVGLALTGDQVAAFAAFEEALYRANEVMNLTRVPREECGLRHFADSLLFQDLIPIGSRVLDLGTGPGFPAWPLACARPDLQITAVDSSSKMLGFLRSQPLPNLTVVQGRAEDLGFREEFDVVTGRAVAPLAIQLEISAAPCRVGGCVIPMRTAVEDLTGVPLGPLGLVQRTVVRKPLGDAEVVRAFPVYEKIRATPRTYPRRWAEMKARPLAGKEAR